MPTKLSDEQLAEIRSGNSVHALGTAKIIRQLLSHCTALEEENVQLKEDLREGEVCEQCDLPANDEHGNPLTFWVCGRCWNPVAQELFEKRKQVSALEEELKAAQAQIAHHDAIVTWFDPVGSEKIKLIQRFRAQLVKAVRGYHMQGFAWRDEMIQLIQTFEAGEVK